MPPRAVASPKKKKSKRKASDASKTSLPKKPRAANPVEITSMPLVSLGLTKVDAADAAPRRSGRPNAGTGGRNVQLEKIGVVLEAKSRNRKPKGTTSLGTLNPVNPQAPEPPRKGRKNRQKVTHIVFVVGGVDCAFRCSPRHTVLTPRTSVPAPRRLIFYCSKMAGGLVLRLRPPLVLSLLARSPILKFQITHISRSAIRIFSLITPAVHDLHQLLPSQNAT